MLQKEYYRGGAKTVDGKSITGKNYSDNCDLCTVSAIDLVVLQNASSHSEAQVGTRPFYHGDIVLGNYYTHFTREWKVYI